MKRVGQGRTFEEQIQYHLDDGRAPNFTVGQPNRVALARQIMDRIIGEIEDQVVIVEPGCGAGDISGPAANAGHIVYGYDLTDAAQEACAERWPTMVFAKTPIEQIEPFDCDIVVMTEFLEHVENPVSIVQKWLPHARFAIIGHPLDEPDPPFEPGHIWSYTREDFGRWFPLGGHRMVEEFRFPMGPWDAMILGSGQRKVMPM